LCEPYIKLIYKFKNSIDKDVNQAIKNLGISSKLKIDGPLNVSYSNGKGCVTMNNYNKLINKSYDKKDMQKIAKDLSDIPYGW